MRFLISLVLSALLAALSGCAQLATQQANAINRGDLDGAERIAVAAIRNGQEVDTSWFNLGAISERRGKRASAISAYSMSARYGNAGAQQVLVKLGAPVPAADLAHAESSNSQTAAYLLDSFNRGYAGGVNCTTFGTGDLMRTNCR